MDTFTYTPIDRERPSFRQVLLRGGIGLNIECELISTAFDEEVLPYEAVSYAWGSPEATMVVKVDGKSKRITTNLHAVLLNLRYPDADRLLWIDAICINQKDNGEKTHQVQRMGQIYKQAERILVYLGSATEHTYSLMRALAKFEARTRGWAWEVSDARWRTEWQVVQRDLKNWHTEQCLGLRELLSKPWFHRVWVLQEVAQARSASVYCGSRHVSTRVFVLAPRLLGETVDDHCQAVLDLMPGPSRNSSFWSQDRGLLTLMRKFRDAEASDERDKIFALLEMCTDSNVTSTLTPDYAKPIEDVIHDTLLSLYALPQRCRFVPPPITMSDFYAEGDRVTNLMFEEAVTTSSVEVMEILLLRHPAKKIWVTSSVVSAASQNIHYGKWVLMMLLRLPPEKANITPDARTYIVSHFEASMVQLLFDHHASPASINDALIEAATKNEVDGVQVLQFLLKQGHDRAFAFSSNILAATCQNKTMGFELMEILLQQPGSVWTIFASTVDAIYLNPSLGSRAMHWLLQRPENQIHITESGMERIPVWIAGRVSRNKKPPQT